MSARAKKSNVLFLIFIYIALFAVPSFSYAVICSDGVDRPTCSSGDPPPSQSGALLRDGIFGCNAARYANVGTLSAIGGVYVPVNDAAVTLNTGYLVYKECVLDGVNSKISEAARTQLTGTVLKDINTGKKGKARFFRDRQEFTEVADKAMKTVVLSEEFVSPMCSALKDKARTTEARRYISIRSVPNAAIACTFPGSAEEYNAALKNGGLKEIGYFISGPNDALSLQLAYQEESDRIRAEALSYMEERLRMGNGFYDVTDENENPFLEKILTPGYLVAQGAEQAVTSGFRCLEGADELSEICAPLFSAMVPETFSSGGLYNMTRAQNGLPSYVNRMVSEASAAVRNEAVNVALNVLLVTRQFEVAFLQAKESAATLLTNAIGRLRSTEKTCWEMIAYNDQGPDKHVCSAPPQGKTCTAVGGGLITIATSTQFSQAVIDAQIAPLATQIAGDITSSAQALKQIDELITMVGNASSAANQREALSRLDQLVAPNSRLPACSPQKTLHNADDVQCATKQRDDISGAIGILVEDTIRAWGDSTDPNVGWCNINNPAVIQKWTNEWK